MQKTPTQPQQPMQQKPQQSQQSQSQQPQQQYQQQTQQQSQEGGNFRSEFRGGYRGGRGGYRGGYRGGRGGFRGGRGGYRGGYRGSFRGGRGRGGRYRGRPKKFENTSETFLTRFPHLADKKEVVEEVYEKFKDYIEQAIRELTNIDKEGFLKKFKINEKVTEDEANSIVKEVKGDLFSSKDSLCHCVSEDLAMSKGVAVGFLKNFGGKEDLQKQGKKPGQVAALKNDNRFIFYLITKEKYFQIPSYENLWKALNEMKKLSKENKVTGISMPVIACGLDRLEWKTVKSMIAAVFKNENISITVYIWEKPQRQLREQNEESQDDNEEQPQD